MKEAVQLIFAFIQAFVGILILMDVWSLKAIAWVWAISGVIMILIFTFVGAATAANKNLDE